MAKDKSKQGLSQKFKVAISDIQKKSPKLKFLALGILAAVVIIIVLAVVLWPSNTATTAQEGDTVKVDYTLTLDDGTEWDSSVNASFGHVTPLQFTIGDGTMVYGFDRGVIGMSVNQTKTIRVSPEDGYGPELYYAALDDLPEDPQIGETLVKQDEHGHNITARVANISGSNVTLENTAELAGQTLHFEITLIELTKATQASGNTSS